MRPRPDATRMRPKNLPQGHVGLQDLTSLNITTSYRRRSCPVSCSIVSSTFRSCNISSSSLRYGLCSLGVATADFSLTAVACSYIISSYIRHREISISKHQSFFNICEIFTGHCSLSICETSIQKVDFGRVETLVLFSPSLDQSSPNYTCTCRSALCMQHHLLTDIFAIKS